MSDPVTTEPAGDEPAAETFTPITSQDDLNKVIGERIARERVKFADYKDLKAKAARLDEIEAANKTEAEKQAERVSALERELEAARSGAMRARIQAKYGVSDEDADLFLTGTDEEALTKQAERLAERAAERKKSGGVAPLAGRTPSSSSASTDERKFVRNLFRSAE